MDLYKRFFGCYHWFIQALLSNDDEKVLRGKRPIPEPSGRRDVRPYAVRLRTAELQSVSQSSTSLNSNSLRAEARIRCQRYPVKLQS